MKNTFYFSLDIVKSGTSKDNKFFIEGYAATKDLDRRGDIIVLDALNQAAAGLLEFGNTVFFNHDYNRCIGRLDEVKVDEIGLWVKIYISQWEEELRKKIEEGIIGKFSIGGKVMAGERVQPSEAVRRFGLKNKPTEAIKVITQMELFEVSVVGLPANAHAEFAHKSFVKAMEDMSHNEELFNLKDAGQIPDNTSTGSPLPKPIAKNVEENAMESTEVKEVIAPVEVKAEAIVTSEKETTAEVVKEAEVAAAPAVVVSEVHTQEAVTVMEANKVTQESVTTDIVQTETPSHKSTETIVQHTVRTYSEEEVNVLKALYDGQLAEKDVLIKTLSAEVDAYKIEKANQVVPEATPAVVQKDLVAEPAIVEPVVEVTKSTPLANEAPAPVVKTVVPFDIEKGFLNCIKGKHK